MTLRLTASDHAMLAGRHGEGARLAMRIVTAHGDAMGAERLLDVASAHVDGCLYQGQASLDFAERLARLGARVSIPTTLNVGAVDLVHPELFAGDAQRRARGRRLMELYAAMGCRTTWTCAPYQLPERPSLGQHVAWAESNAIVFANSVLGARTDRYGDFIDICAAITGRAPAAGFHLDPNRLGRVLLRITGVGPALLAEDSLYPVLGHLVGKVAGSRVPVIEGLPASATEDQLKALGAAAASSGAIGMFHAVGVTPEAGTVEQAFGGREPAESIEVSLPALTKARDELTTAMGDRIDAVSVGTPHFSVAEFARLTSLLERISPAGGVDFFVSTSRHVLAEVKSRGWLNVCVKAGVNVVVDTCTYVTPVLKPSHHVVMTNSAKWAFYAPGNIGVQVVFGSLEECVRSAAEGRVWRDGALWS